MNGRSLLNSSITLLTDARPASGCDYHRITLPYGELREVQPKVPTVVFNRVHRMGTPFLQAAKRSGYKVICDLDDCPDLDPDHYLVEIYRRNKMTERIVEAMDLADYITVTTEILAGHLMRHFDVPLQKIVVIPNALPFDRGQFVRNSTDTGGEYIYAGGASHYMDTLLLPDLGPRLTFAGWQDDHPEWNRIRAAHPTSKYAQSRDVASYMGLYEGYRVSLAPLRYTRFNRCKSNLKVLEAGAVGIPIVCSKVPPYDNDRDRAFVLYNNFRASPPGRIGEDLAAHVREHYHLDDVNDIRRQLLESLS